MSEQTPHTLEHTQEAEKLPETPERLDSQHTHETAPQPAEKAPKANVEHMEDAARQTIEHEAFNAEVEVSRTEREEPAASPSAIGREMQSQALHRTLKHIRQRLSAPEKALSKVIHQSVVDSVSELSGKTVARPSGILGGGICAFAGSLLFLYFSKHYGFHYNYLIFTMFFVGGFAIGLVFEILIRLIKQLRS